MKITAVLALIAGLLGGLSSGASGQEAGVVISASPATVEAGSSVQLTGYCRPLGFVADPNVDLYWLAVPGAAPYAIVVDAIANEQGEFDVSVTIPSDAPSGTYQAALGCFIDDQGFGEPAYAQFTVVGGSDPVTTTTSAVTTTSSSIVEGSKTSTTATPSAFPPQAGPATPVPGDPSFTG